MGKETRDDELSLNCGVSLVMGGWILGISRKGRLQLLSLLPLKPPGVMTSCLFTAHVAIYLKRRICSPILCSDPTIIHFVPGNTANPLMPDRLWRPSLLCVL